MKRKPMNYSPLRTGIRLFGILSALSFMISCDDLEEDKLAPDTVHLEPQEIFIPARHSTVISLMDGIGTGAAVSIEVTGQPEHGTLENIGKGYFRYTPKADFTDGKDTFGYEVRSGSVSYGKNEIQLVVSRDTLHLPCRPYAFQDEAETMVNQAVEIDVLANDWLCDSLQTDSLDDFSIVCHTQNGRASIEGRRVKYTPRSNFQGNDFFIYKICQGSECSLSYVGVEVVGDSLPHCLVVRDDEFMYRADDGNTEMVFDILDNDDLCSDSFTGITEELIGQSLGEASIDANHQLRYRATSQAGQRYIDTLIYKVCNQQINECDSARIIISVELPQDSCHVMAFYDEFFLPSSDSLSTDSVKVYIDVLANDIICPQDSVYLDLVQQPRNGLASVEGNRIRYQKKAGISLSDTLIYRICQSQDNCDEAGVSIK